MFLIRLLSDNGVTNLCTDYGQVPTTSRRQPTSLLDALENNEKNLGEAGDEDSLPGEEKVWTHYLTGVFDTSDI